MHSVWGAVNNPSNPTTERLTYVRNRQHYFGVLTPKSRLGLIILERATPASASSASDAEVMVAMILHRGSADEPLPLPLRPSGYLTFQRREHENHSLG